MIIHTVQKGDTLDSLAAQYNISKTRIEQDNNLPPNSTLTTGQSLMILYPQQTYTVQNGDTLESVARAFNTSILQLLRNNPQVSDRNPITINIGEELVINYDTTKGKVEVYGYANEFITPKVLTKTLPYLTYLAILNYKITAEGDLIDISDTELINTSKQYGVAPVMFASSITEQGVGSTDVTHIILNNRDIQSKLIDNLLFMLKSKGYYALEITLVYVLPEDLPAYVAFLSDVTSRLNNEGYEVFVSLLPSTFGYQPGVPYENSYYSDIGKAVNYVILISFLWPNASIPQVAASGAEFLREYVNFAITQIPPEKIFVGLARMAYDWELPYVEGQTPGRLITSFGALTLATQLGSTIQFDESTQTPYFYYTESGIEHFVWFKDAKTVEAILDLVPEYGLKGFAIWNIMYYYSPTWLALNTQYEIENVLNNSLN